MSYSPSPKPLAWADRLYTPFCGQHLPEAPVTADPFEALAADFVPNPTRSYEQAQRWRHVDLRGLGDGRLWRELRQAESLLTWLPEDDCRLPWIAERRRALAGEQRRRKAAQ